MIKIFESDFDTAEEKAVNNVIINSKQKVKHPEIKNSLKT